MSNLREFYKVDALKQEIADLQKQLADLKKINGALKKQLEMPTKQNYESMKNREFLSEPENQAGVTIKLMEPEGKVKYKETKNDT